MSPSNSLKNLLCTVLLAAMSGLAVADSVTVGTGTPASCTEATLQAALPILNPGIQGPGGTLTFNCGAGLHTIPLTTQVFLSDDSTIDGGGTIILDGQNMTRLFHVGGEGTRAALRNLRLVRGFAANDFGGAVLVQPGAHLTLTVSLIANSRAGQTGGAIAVFPGGSLEIDGATLQANRARDGGAIASSGPTTISNAEFLDNIAEVDQGGALQIWTTTLVMTNVTLDRNQGRQGGALLQRGGTSQLTDVQFRDNMARHEGGGFHLYENGVADLLRVQFTGNTATSRGGGLFVAHGDAMEFPDLGTNRANIMSGFFSGNSTPGQGGAIASGILPNQLIGGGVIRMDQTVITGNTANRGGGLFVQGPLVASRSRVENGSAVDGGGLYVDNDIGRASLLFDRFSLENNTANTAGGGLLVRNGASPFAVQVSGLHAEGNRAFNGGGVAVVGRGNTRIDATSLVGNEATSAGGGLFVEDDETRVEDTTFSGNRAIGGMNFSGVGGDVFVRNQVGFLSSVDLAFSTLFFGDANQGSSLYAEGGAGDTVRIRIGQSIVQPSPLSGPAVATVGSGTIGSLGGNIGVALPNCNPCTDISVASFSDLGLGSRVELGNGTFAHVPGASSPVLDNVGCAANSRDQAGNPRPAGPACDRGAIERQPPVVDAVFANGFE